MHIIQVAEAKTNENVISCMLKKMNANEKNLSIKKEINLT